MWKRPCRSAATCTTLSSSGFARRASRFRSPLRPELPTCIRKRSIPNSRQVGLSFLKLAKVSRDRAPLSAYTYCHDPQLEIAKGPDNAPDDLGRLPAGAELHESPEFLAPSAFAHRYLVRGLLPAYWPGAGGGQVPSRRSEERRVGKEWKSGRGSER